jgi:predicted PurR-regulated permease PerM
MEANRMKRTLQAYGGTLFIMLWIMLWIAVSGLFIYLFCVSDVVILRILSACFIVVGVLQVYKVFTKVENKYVMNLLRTAIAFSFGLFAIVFCGLGIYNTVQLYKDRGEVYDEN